jgi:hypothetical protein
MLSNKQTLEKLRDLEALYQEGYGSDLISRSVDKLIDLERMSAERELADLSVRLQSFEARYQMPSEVFYQRFQSGALGDEIDFVEWSAFYEMWQSTQKRLNVLNVGSAG